MTGCDGFVNVDLVVLRKVGQMKCDPLGKFQPRDRFLSDLAAYFDSSLGAVPLAT